MIKYNLKCKNKHEFESWFSDSKEFEKLLKKKIIECLFCKTKSVKKSIMSPRISSRINITPAEPHSVSFGPGLNGAEFEGRVRAGVG